MAERKPSLVLAHFATRIATITSESGALTESGYRFRLEEEPDTGLDGKFYVDFESLGPPGPWFGTTESKYTGRVVVRVAFFRGGGDAGGGDRQSVMRNAADDMQRIADVIPDPDDYDGTNTGITIIKFTGAARVFEGKAREIWEARFDVEWRSDVITA